MAAPPVTRRSAPVRLPLPRPAIRRAAPVVPRRWRGAVGLCVALGAVSLLLHGVPTYDPWSWIIWGREIAHGQLDTIPGRSWKPLPVLFSTPLSLFGDGAAQALWLVVSRAGGLLGILMAARLAARVAGAPAGVAA